MSQPKDQIDSTADKLKPTEYFRQRKNKKIVDSDNSDEEEEVDDQDFEAKDKGAVEDE